MYPGHDPMAAIQQGPRGVQARHHFRMLTLAMEENRQMP
jgi:hypothetical protein